MVVSVPPRASDVHGLLHAAEISELLIEYSASASWEVRFSEFTGIVTDLVVWILVCVKCLNLH